MAPQGYKVMLVDLADAANATAEAKEKAKSILNQLSISLDKVEAKTDPSVFLHINDSLHRVKPATLGNVADFKAFADRVSKVKLAATIRDLVDTLKANNTELDSLTIVYCTDGNPKTYEQEQKALRMLTHESQHQVLEVRDLGMARFIKMEPGKFYCYYKPSYANGFPTDPSGSPMQNKEAL